MDAVLICCSIQYLQQPEKVFAEIHRVLRPGGVCIITFTSRMFWSKAIQVWREGSSYSRLALVKQYFNATTGFTAPQVVTEVKKEQPNKRGGTPASQRSDEAAGLSLPSIAMLAHPFERLLTDLRKALALLGGEDPFFAVIAYKE